MYYFQGAGELDEMNENGELRRIFNHFKVTWESNYAVFNP